MVTTRVWPAARSIWKSEFVVLAVAIEIVRLRGKFGSLEDARVVGEISGVGGDDDGVAGVEGGVDALELRDRQDDVLRPRQGDGIRDGELNAPDARRRVQGGGHRQSERTAYQFHLVS